MTFNFGSGATKPGSTFGSTSTAKVTGAVQPFSLGGSTSTAGSTSFNFGATATTQAAKPAGGLFGGATTTTSGTLGGGFGSGFNFGGATATAATTAASGFSFGTKLGGGGLTATATTASVLSLTTATTAAPSFKGLGGVSSAASTTNQSDNGNKGNGVSQALKDQQVPDDLCKDVKNFEDFVKKQKDGSNTVGKFSVQALRKIQEEVSSLSYALGTVSSALHRNNAAVQKLRSDFTEELRNIEMARHTQDIPPSLQHDNISPLKFFMVMVIEFEGSMQTYRKQIEELENHLNLTHQTSNLTPQDIYVALCKMQETFITLAANLHSIHDQVKTLKEQYLIYRRIVHNEEVDIFAKSKQKIPQDKNTKSTGISPFNQLSNVAALAMAAMVNQQRQQQQGPPQQGFLSTNTAAGGTGLFGSAAKPAGTASLFGATSSTGTSKFGGFGGFGSTTKPLSAGFGTSASSNLFGSATSSSFNTSAGLTFGGAATSTPAFELKRPPLGGTKRGKKS